MHDLGTRVLRHRTLVKSFENIVDACVELGGLRDPRRVFEMLGTAVETAAQAEGTSEDDVDVSGLVDFMKSDEGVALFKEHTKAQLVKLRVMAWGVLDSVARWIEEEPDFSAVEMPATREALTAKFEERVAEWTRAERPELVFAERAWLARLRIEETPANVLETVDCWRTLLVFLDARVPR
jgi:hypothetical protein